MSTLTIIWPILSKSLTLCGLKVAMKHLEHDGTIRDVPSNTPIWTLFSYSRLNQSCIILEHIEHYMPYRIQLFCLVY